MRALDQFRTLRASGRLVKPESKRNLRMPVTQRDGLLSWHGVTNRPDLVSQDTVTTISTASIGMRVIAARGNVGSHTGDTTETSVLASPVTLPGGELGANGVLEVWVGARITAGAPLVGTWQLRVLLGGTAIGHWEMDATIRSLYRGRFVHNNAAQNDQRAASIYAGVDDAYTLDYTTAAVDTSVDQALDVKVKLNDIGDIAETITVFGLLVRANKAAV